MINKKCSKDSGVHLGDGGDLDILGIWVRVLKHLREKQGSQIQYLNTNGFPHDY